MALDNFFNDVIQRIKPDDGEEKEINSTINKVSDFMKANTPFKIDKTIVGGSYGKKTNLKKNFEVDLVYIIRPEEDINKLSELLEKVEKYIIENKFGKNSKAQKKAVYFKRNNVDVDVLPGYELSSPYEIKNINDKDFYKGSTSIFHLQYAKERETIYTNTVRVIKQWRNNCLHGNLKNVNSFALELLFGGIFDKYNDELKNVNQGFKKFLEYISEIKLQVYIEIESFNPFKTVIMYNDTLHLQDPGDPSNIIKVQKGLMTAIVNCARYTLKRYNNTDLENILRVYLH